MTSLPRTGFPTLDALGAQLAQGGSETLFPKIIEECQRLTKEGHNQDEVCDALETWEAFWRS